MSVVPYDHPNPVHIFANIGVDSRDSFLPARVHRSPGHQTLKDSSAHQGTPRVTLEGRSRTRAALIKEKSCSYFPFPNSLAYSQAVKTMAPHLIIRERRTATFPVNGND